jgi:hypothetical protein
MGINLLVKVLISLKIFEVAELLERVTIRESDGSCVCGF